MSKVERKVRGEATKMIHITVPTEMKDMLRYLRYRYNVQITELVRLCILYAYFEFWISDNELDVVGLDQAVDSYITDYREEGKECQA